MIYVMGNTLDGSLGTQPGAAFTFRGGYRTQNRRRAIPSVLHGRWLEVRRPGLLDSARVNVAVTGHQAFAGGRPVRLRPALVSQRSGAFAEDDALYYRDFFELERGRPPMETDILDVTKLLRHWRVRWACLGTLLGPGTLAAFAGLVPDVASAAVNEYLCHEGGHAIGWCVGAKYDAAYFRPNGRVAWPLVYVEEFRADLNSLGIALTLLEPAQAVAVFVYHILHRLGVAAASGRSRTAGAGLVPYLLFCVLAELGFLRPVEHTDGTCRLTVSDTDPGYLLHLMARCSQHGLDHLVAPERSASDAMAVALSAAEYYRGRVGNRQRLADFDRLFFGVSPPLEPAA